MACEALAFPIHRLKFVTAFSSWIYFPSQLNSIHKKVELSKLKCLRLRCASFHLSTMNEQSYLLQQILDGSTQLKTLRIRNFSWLWNDINLASLDFMTNLTQLELINCTLNNNSCTSLANLKTAPNLHYLNISKNQSISVSGLCVLSRTLINLKKLDITRTGIHNYGFRVAGKVMKVFNESFSQLITLEVTHNWVFFNEHLRALEAIRPKLQIEVNFFRNKKNVYV